MKKYSKLVLLILFISLIANVYLYSQLINLRINQLNITNELFNDISAYSYSTASILTDISKTGTVTIEVSKKIDLFYKVYLIEHLNELDMIMAKNIKHKDPKDFINYNKFIKWGNILQSITSKPYQSQNNIYYINNDEKNEINKIEESLSNIQTYIQYNIDLNKKYNYNSMLEKWQNAINYINRQE